MDILKLAKNAIEFLKTKSKLPESGIIAGGSLGNLIWEQVSGNVAVVNDIDIFIFENKINKTEVSGESTVTQTRQKLFYRSQEKIYWKEYTGLCEGTKTNQFYYIERTENAGILNRIYYSATSDDPGLIIDSFDINCTQICYSIEEDKFYWTPEFEKFLQNGKLQLTNLGSPHHSAIRIVKKKYELNAELDPLELKIAAYTISRPLNGVTRRYFSDKYFEVFKKYHDLLKPYFSIIRENEISQLIKDNKGVDVGIFTLNCLLNSDQIFTDYEIEKEIRGKIWHCNDFLFFIRNIEKDTLHYKIWSKLQPLYVYDNYVDCDPQDKDLDLMTNLINYIPGVIKNLQNISLSNQIKLVKKLVSEFSDDPTIAFAILENQKIDIDMVLDESTKLLLELSVRTKIVNNNYPINTILGKPDDLIF